MSVRARAVAIATLMVLSAYFPAAAQNAPITPTANSTGGDIRGRVMNGASKTPIGMSNPQKQGRDEIDQGGGDQPPP